MGYPHSGIKSILAFSIVGLLLTGCTATQIKNPFAKNSQQVAPKFAEGKKKLKNPNKVYLAYAKLQEQTGNTKDARASYHAVLEENPKSVDAMLGLARLDHLAGRADKAEFSFQRALKENKNDPNTLDAVGQFYASQQDWPKAIKHLNEAALASPHEPVYRYHLAVAMARSGDIDGALAHFVKTVGDAQAHYNIGYILEEQGRKAEAIQHLQLALSKKPDLLAAHNKLVEIQQAGVQLTNARIPGGQPSRQNIPTQSFQPQQPLHQLPQTAGALTPDSTTPQPLIAKVWRGPVSVQKLAPLPPAANQNPAAPQTQYNHPQHLQQTQYAPTTQANQNHQPQRWQPQPAPPAQRFNQYQQVPQYPQPPAGLTPQQREQWQNQFAPSR